MGAAGPMWNMFRSQFITLPSPQTKFTGKTVVVTGSNGGLGLATARHFVRLDAAKVILAVRSIKKGNVAAKDIDRTEKRPGVVEVWELDLASYSSVKDFAARASRLDRLDILVENAAVYAWDFVMAGEDELTITVNVVNTMLLGILLVPKLRETSLKYGSNSVLVFVGSFVHRLTEFPERHQPDIWAALQDGNTARLNDRYNVSKLMQLLLSREFAAELANSKQDGHVVTSTINPGWVATNIMNGATNALFKLWLGFAHRHIARTPDEGALTVINAAQGDEETHGQYLSDCRVEEPSKLVTSAEGRELQKQLWRDVSVKLERIAPGAMSDL